jgi:hypothetical protein
VQQYGEGHVGLAPTDRSVDEWWDAYMAAHEEPDSIDWNEFKMVFRSHHVPQGIIKLKKKEF